ncbi:MAG TPA: FtsQ-type POTRA domain-containing protein [Nocardioides sp.]|nr:FtsQ-type POTRA domain-containing protein [Nocardioides sp.]
MARKPAESDARTRRAFARRQWSRRWLTWKYVVASVLLLAVVVGGIWTVWFSSVLAVERVDVSGETTLTRADVLTAARVPVGDPLARVDIAEIASRVRALAVVRTVDVTREWPHAVRISITERTPIAVVDIAGQLKGLDSEGVVFRSYARQPPALPRIQISSETTQDALREGAAVVAALPDTLAQRVDHLQVDTIDEITLVLRDGREVVWGSSEDSDVKAEVLAALLRQKGHTFDVSAPGQPTVR